MFITPKYNTRIGFGEIYTDADTFASEVITAVGKPITEAHIKELFYLLYAKYGNTPIANFDETQWKYRIFTTISTYGPEWEKKHEIQEKLKNLSLESGDLFEGAKAIYNNAQNPSTKPGTNTDEELSYINAQNVSKNKKGKLDAYGILWNMLNSNENEWFLSKFSGCFLKFVNRNIGPVFITKDDDDE